MAGPIGYTPPPNPYAAQPIEPQAFHGLNILPGMAAAQQAEAPADAQIAKSEAYDTQAAKAAKFQKLLQSGQQGMQSYIQDVGKTHPELAAQFTQEYNSIAPHMEGMKGKDLADLALNTYDSWNGRYNGAKMANYMQANPEATMTDKIANSGGSLGVKDELSLQSLDDQRQTSAKLAQSKIDWYEQLPQLKKDLQASQNASRERARALTLQNGKVKVNPATAKTNLKATLIDIKDAQERIKGLEGSIGENATMANVNGLNGALRDWNTQLHRLIKDRDSYQAALGPSAFTEADPTGDAGGGSGTDSMPGSDAPPTYTGPAMPTAQSTDAEVMDFLRNYRDPKTNRPLVLTPDVIANGFKSLGRKPPAAP